MTGGTPAAIPGPLPSDGMAARDRLLGRGYVVWGSVAVGLALLKGGLSADNLTRLLVIAFLLLQLGLRGRMGRVGRSLQRLSPRPRFVLSASLLACVVEGFYMISRPAFPSLRIGPETPFAEGLARYAIDLSLTLPCYLIIFSVVWWCINRYRYSFWEYVLVMAAGQALGDGFVFFVAAPGMLLFLPYTMLNYHAVNVTPFLAARADLPAGARPSAARFLALPLLVATYLACGACIALVGKTTGMGP